MTKGIGPASILAIATLAMIGGGIWTVIDSEKHGNVKPKTPDAGVSLKTAKDAGIDAAVDAAKDAPMALEDLSGRVQVALPKNTAELCDLATHTCIQVTKVAK